MFWKLLNWFIIVASYFQQSLPYSCRHVMNTRNLGFGGGGSTSVWEIPKWLFFPPCFLEEFKRKNPNLWQLLSSSLGPFLKPLFGWLDAVVSCGLIVSSNSTQLWNLLVSRNLRKSHKESNLDRLWAWPVGTILLIRAGPFLFLQAERLTFPPNVRNILYLSIKTCGTIHQILSLPVVFTWL